MQKVGAGQAIESLETLVSTDQAVPFHTRTSPSSSGAVPKVGDAQATLVMPSFGFGHRIWEPADHEAPFHTYPAPFGPPARQKVAEVQDTWLRFCWASTFGADQAVPFQVMALPTVLLATTAAQKLGEPHETDA